MARTSAGFVQELRGGCYAWRAENGGWGWSNAGLVVGYGESLVVDTLFDLKLTRRMLAGFAGPTATAPIRTIVNTHANGDHWFGNELLPQATVVASTAAAAEMRQVGPREVEFVRSQEGAGGVFAGRVFAPFAIDEVTARYPTRTFDGRLDLDVGGVRVELIEVGPAHTEGDVVVHVPSARVAFAGDILFAGSTPVVWAGPVSGWLDACQVLLDLDVDIIVPGHGPVTDKLGVRQAQDYLRFVHAEATDRHAAGMTAEEAAGDIDLGRFVGLPEGERLAINVHTVYREIDPSTPPLIGQQLFGCMAALTKE